MSVTRSTRLFLPMLALYLAFSAACDSPARVVVEDKYPTSCDDGEGIVHTHATGTWKAADGPHRLEQTSVRGTELTIEAGALICAGPGATLEVGELSAVGTAEAPITFAALDPQDPWHGLAFNHDCCQSGRWTLHHVVIRNGAGGVLANRLDLRHARVENMCQGDRCTAVSGTGYGGITLEDVVIDGSGGAGVSSGWRGSISLTRVRILNSKGIGLSAGYQVGLKVDGLRIAGGESYPASVASRHVDKIAGSREAVDSLLGNAKDTLLVENTQEGVVDSITIFRDLPWEIRYAYLGTELLTRSVVLEAGASVIIPRYNTWQVRRLVSEGTAENPVRLTGGSLGWMETEGEALQDTVRLTHTVLRDVEVGWAVQPVSLEVDHVAATRSRFWIQAGTTARMRHMALDSSQIVVETGEALLEDVDLRHAVDSIGALLDPRVEGPHAIWVAGGTAEISGCTVTGSGADAIHVSDTAAGTTITGCNLFGNTGFGVNNLSAFAVDASGNWWGDPAGPDGPEGDGVSGDVVVEPVLTEPVRL